MYAQSRKNSLFGLIALVSLTLSGCDIAVTGDGGFQFDLAAGKAQDEWTRTYPMTAAGRLEIINVNGRITAEASDDAAVEVRAERSAKAATDESARDLLGRIEMREEVGEGRVRVEVRAPRTNGPSSHEIKWTVKVPRGVAVDLRTVNGAVKLTGLQGDIRARSTNGGITGSAIAANVVDAAVTNGGVEIELARAATGGHLDLEAVNGGVTLLLPPDSKADIAARCTNGGISVDNLDVRVTDEEHRNVNEFEEKIEGKRRFRRRLDGQLNGGGAKVSLETVNGGVRIGTSGTRDSATVK
jgi:hypothetical protein